MESSRPWTLFIYKRHTDGEFYFENQESFAAWKWAINRLIELNRRVPGRRYKVFKEWEHRWGHHRPDERCNSHQGSDRQLRVSKDLFPRVAEDEEKEAAPVQAERSEPKESLDQLLTSETRAREGSIRHNRSTGRHNRRLH